MRAVLLALWLAPGGAWADVAPLRLDAGPAVVQFGLDDIASATVEPSPDGEPALRVKLALARWPDLRLFTADAVGQEAVVTVCGEEVARPLIQAPIEEGVFVLQGMAPDLRARAVAALTGAAPCGGP